MAGIQFFAGQRLTAADLQKTVPTYYTLGSDETRTSTITTSDTNLVIPVDGLSMLNVEIRWDDKGGGMRWGWTTSSGSITVHSVAQGTWGNASSGSSANVADLRWQHRASFAEQTIANFTSTAVARISEEMILDGSGEITLQFAQETSNANATTLLSSTWVTLSRLGES